MDFDYKKYSLEKLKTWIEDAVSGDASPHEIYSVIREAVREDYYYHKDRTSRAGELLALLNGNGKDHLFCDKNNKSPECQEAWNSFWEENYYPEEYKSSTVSSVNLDTDIEEIRKEGGYDWTPPTKFEKSEHYYDYTRNDPNRKNPFEKVKKWVLPVEECKDADTDETEYFVSFPDDLLEAANLKEGNLVEWVDQGDGSYLIKKVEKEPITYDEMIAAGYTMTDDGFWIKE
jgi:hypothetical protein